MKGFRGLAVLVACALALALGACAETQLVANSTKLVTAPPAPPPRPAYKVGQPYQIEGAWYYPKVDYSYDESGIASWYGPDFNGRPSSRSPISRTGGRSSCA
jgi:rare lipoprotein A